MKKGYPQVRYSEEFKRMVVGEIEAGVMNVTQACRFYGVSGVSAYKWIELYGLNEQKGKKVTIMTHREENELVMLRRELLVLKKALEEAELRSIAWESMVEAIEEDLGLKVKKKPWSQALQDARQKLFGQTSASGLDNAASSTELQSKADTKGKKPLKRK